MAIVQKRSKHTLSGGTYRLFLKKAANLGSEPTRTFISPPIRKLKRQRGGAPKLLLLATNQANVYDPTSKRYAQAAIKTVVDNPANRNFIRRNIMTKGAIIQTSLGKARITSRPGQEHTINAVLIE